MEDTTNLRHRTWRKQAVSHLPEDWLFLVSEGTMQAVKEEKPSDPAEHPRNYANDLLS